MPVLYLVNVCGNFELAIMCCGILHSKMFRVYIGGAQILPYLGQPTTLDKSTNTQGLETSTLNTVKPLF